MAPLDRGLAHPCYALRLRRPRVRAAVEEHDARARRQRSAPALEIHAKTVGAIAAAPSVCAGTEAVGEPRLIGAAAPGGARLRWRERRIELPPYRRPAARPEQEHGGAIAGRVARVAPDHEVFGPLP